jgi:hypothetical protein
MKLRFFDPDYHLIEIGVLREVFVRRQAGTAEEAPKKTGITVEKAVEILRGSTKGDLTRRRVVRLKTISR